MFGTLKKAFSGGPEGKIKKLYHVVEQINDYEKEYDNLTKEELKGLTDEFRERLEEGESLDQILPEAFAAVRAVSKRELGMRHYDVQLIGGMVLHQGKIAEMRTGEGKTLVATLPAYLNALSTTVHVITINDYLAKRDASWMGSVYNALGLSVACIQNSGALMYKPKKQSEGEQSKFSGVAGADMVSVSKKEAYLADIVYGTNSEIGFDYLRDNIATSVKDLSRANTKSFGFGYVIVDEVDNILIDEARTPLIISGPAPESSVDYRLFSSIAKNLKANLDYEINVKNRYITLTPEGINRSEKLLGKKNLYSPENQSISHSLDNAIRAEVFFRRDKDYIVNEGGVVLVDEHTGRLMPGRRLSEGLHQAIEAKENVKVQRESMTFATITLQNYFLKYDKLSGMTGTAMTESEEFFRIYKLDVVPIPTNKTYMRNDLKDQIYTSEKAKWQQIVEKIISVNQTKTPILVGTTSIEKADYLSGLLRKKGVKFSVLNARDHEKEAQIIAEAGSPGAITVATNVAGRGTDIVLGGNPDALGIDQAAWQEKHDNILKKGGLFVLGTERHDSRRIDNQLRGRAGRQGEPGVTQFFVSMEDEILKRMGGERLKKILDALKLEDGEAMESRIMVGAIKNAQQKIEGVNFEIRRNLLSYDDVVNTQRDVVYKLRHKVLLEGLSKEVSIDMLSKTIETLLERVKIAQKERDKNATQAIKNELLLLLPKPGLLERLNEVFENEASDLDAFADELDQCIEDIYSKRENEFGKEKMEIIVRVALLRSIDASWVRHLTTMDNMRQSVGLEAVAQRNPIVQYKRSAFEMFANMMDEIRGQVSRLLFNMHPVTKDAKGKVGPGKKGGRGGNAQQKLGRNDPCHCGSQKKYKKCHGKNV